MGNSTANLTITTGLNQPKNDYNDLEAFNRSPTQVMRRTKLLNMNVEKLKRKRKKNPKIELFAEVGINEWEEKAAREGHERMIDNFDNRLAAM